MKIVRHAAVRLAFLAAIAPVAGCTFGMFPRESRDPALAALPPCYAGDVCGIGFDGAGFAWARDVVQTARR